MKVLRNIQTLLLGVSLFLLAYLPLFSAFGEPSGEIKNIFYQISFFAVFLVILIRPLADIFSSQKWLRKLLILRKGMGVFSASIVVGFMLGDVISPGSSYLASIFTPAYWSLKDYVFFAHVGDITGFILLVTSNNLSMILLGKIWHRIQNLAYVYFYTGGIYEAFFLGSAFAFYAMIMVTCILMLAFLKNKKKK